MNRRIALAPALAVAALALVACSGGGNNPFPTGTTTADTSAGSSSTGGSGGDALASVQPCSLLSSSALSQNGLTQTGSGPLAGARTCKWQQPVGSDSNGNTTGYALEIAIWDQQGIADVNTDGYTVSSHPIGSRQATELAETGGVGCDIAMAVTSASRVDVIATADSADVNTSCQVAVQFATLIDPELPAEIN